jgi:Protein of unknown function (DUF2567)
LHEEPTSSDECLHEEADMPMNDQAPPAISRTRAMLTVVVALAAVGVVVGALWAWLAPAVHGVIALTKDGERVQAALGNEADHFFLAAFLLVGMVSVAAAVMAVLVWQWRAHRGPVMVAGLAVGAAAAAAVAAAVGAVLVHWRYGSVDIAAAPISPAHRVYYIVEAPAVFFSQSPIVAALTIVMPAGIAALVYALIAMATARDDLGAWPPVEPDSGGPAVTAESVLPSAP